MKTICFHLGDKDFKLAQKVKGRETWPWLFMDLIKKAAKKKKK